MDAATTGLLLYGILACGALLSLAGGTLLCALSTRAVRQTVSRTHEGAVLQILACLGFADAVFAAGSLATALTGTALPPYLRTALPLLRLAVGGEACFGNNLILTLSLLWQSTWSAALAWYLGRVLLGMRPAEEWWDHRLKAHAVTWGVPVLITGSLFGPRSAVLKVCDADAAASSVLSPDVFVALVLTIPLASVVYTLWVYLRVLFTFWRVAREAGTATPRRIELRLSSYLAAFLLCQAAPMCYHLSCLIPQHAHPVPFSAPVFYRESQGWLLWVWYATQPLQGFVDALVYLHHARSVSSRQLSSGGGGLLRLVCARPRRQHQRH